MIERATGLSPATPLSPGAGTGKGKRNLTWWISGFGIAAIHVFTVYAIVRGVTWKLLLLAAATYWIRMFAITAFYHRYFSHRAYKTSRAFQFIIALLGVTATQKGPIWWASTHRHHHKHSDDETRRPQPAPSRLLVLAHVLVARR